MVIRIYRKLRERIEMVFLRPHQSTSLALRRIFAERHSVHVGLYSYGCFDQWRMPGPIQIGRWCSIANTVRSASINHPLSAMTTHPALFEKSFGIVDADVQRTSPLIVEDDVWVGHNAMILPGCKFIGRGAVVGAGSVVTRDVAPYTIVAGNPARVIRSRFTPDLIEALEQSRWWTMDAAEMRTIFERDPSLLFSPRASKIREWIGARTGTEKDQ